jgi:hypothetical protein
MAACSLSKWRLEIPRHQILEPISAECRSWSRTFLPRHPRGEMHGLKVGRLRKPGAVKALAGRISHRRRNFASSEPDILQHPIIELHELLLGPQQRAVLDVLRQQLPHAGRDISKRFWPYRAGSLGGRYVRDTPHLNSLGAHGHLSLLFVDCRPRL